MKARLKSSEVQKPTMLSEMQVMQFAVVVSGDDKGHIVFRPKVGVFAIDLIDGECWEIKPKYEHSDREVRILEAGETIEITE